MSGYFKEKKPFAKSVVVKDTKEDFGLGEVGYKIAFWADPSRPIVSKFLNVMFTKREELDEMDEEELKKINEDFWVAVSSIIVDTNIEGLSFDTPEEAQASFDSPDIDHNFLIDCIMSYVQSVLSESSLLKKK